MLPVCSSTGKISPALNQFQSCHNQGWKFNFFAAKTSILKTRGARLWIFWQLPDRVATTGQLTTGPAVWSISWGWGELVLDRLDLPAKKKCYEVWIFMWLLPPPRYSCRSAYAEKRKGSWRVLGRRPALLPTRRAEGNPPRSLPQSLHLRMVSDNQARKKEKKKKSKQCFPKTCQDYPKVSALSLLRLLWLQPSKPRAQRFKSLCSSSRAPVKVDTCYEGRLWRGAAGSFLLVLSIIYSQWRKFTGEHLSCNWGTGLQVLTADSSAAPESSRLCVLEPDALGYRLI